MKIVNSSLSIPVPLTIIGPNKAKDTIIIAPRGTVELPAGFTACPRDYAKHKHLLRKKVTVIDNTVPEPVAAAPDVLDADTDPVES